jgi:hypothetical protein
MKQGSTYSGFLEISGEATPKVHIPYHERYKRLSITLSTIVVKSAKIQGQNQGAGKKFTRDLFHRLELATKHL